MLKVPLVVEMTAVVVGALSGATHAVGRKADIVGMFSLAMSTAVGGSMIRDILTGVSPPLALSRPIYLPVVAVAALGAMLFAQRLSQLKRALARIDACLLGLWTVIGTEQALGHGLPVTSAVFVGTVTAVGGGLVRDIMTGDIPAIFVRGELYATAAFAAALLYPLVVRALGAPNWLGELTTVAAACLIRLSALRWRIVEPEPIDLPTRWREARRRREPPRH